MIDFKPYEVPPMYQVELCEEEVLLIQRLRSVNFGSIRVHVTKCKLVRTETITGALFGNSNEKITIETETVI